MLETIIIVVCDTIAIKLFMSLTSFKINYRRYRYKDIDKEVSNLIDQANKTIQEGLIEIDKSLDLTNQNRILMLQNKRNT